MKVYKEWLADENNNIYLNARLNADARAQALRHEVEHIRRGHLYEQTKSVQAMEREVNDGCTKEDEVGKLAPDLVYREG